MKRNPKFSLACILLVIVTGLFLTACNPEKKLDHNYLYFQKNLDSMGMVNYSDPLLKRNDLISIQVFSKGPNQRDAALFNAQSSASSGTNANGAVQYSIGADGSIEFPVLEKIKAAGLTRSQLEEDLGKRLSSYVKEPYVTIKLLNFNVNVLGEVRNPGNHSFAKDRVTLLDALGAAGDLTQDGKRQDILVIREDSGDVRKYYNIDLRDAMFFRSPAFELQPNDVVYVGATDRKLKNVSINPQSGKGLQVVLGIISVAVAVATIVNLSKK